MPTTPKLLAALLLPLFAFPTHSPAQTDAPLPPGVTTNWDLHQAAHQTTPTRERISINGLWRWQPAQANSTNPPSDAWGFFKVPGPWPGITDYLQKDCQTVFKHPAWTGQKLDAIHAAWYERQFSAPSSLAGRRISLNLSTRSQTCPPPKPC